MASRFENASGFQCDVDSGEPPFSANDRFRLTTDGHSALAAYDKSPFCLVQCEGNFVWGEEIES